MSSILVVFLQNMNSIVNVLDFLVQYHEARLPYTQQHQSGAVMWLRGVVGVPYAQHQQLGRSGDVKNTRKCPGMNQ